MPFLFFSTWNGFGGVRASGFNLELYVRILGWGTHSEDSEQPAWFAAMTSLLENNQKGLLRVNPFFSFSLPLFFSSSLISLDFWVEIMHRDGVEQLYD